MWFLWFLSVFRGGSFRGGRSTIDLGWSGGRLNCIRGFVSSVINGFFESVDLFDKCLNACVTLTLFGCFPFGGVDDVVDEFLSGEG